MNTSGDGMPKCKYEVRPLEVVTGKTDETQSAAGASWVNFGGRMRGK